MLATNFIIIVITAPFQSSKSLSLIFNIQFIMKEFELKFGLAFPELTSFLELYM